MKKFLMMALVAVMAFSAQAVTWTWDNLNNAASSTETSKTYAGNFKYKNNVGMVKVGAEFSVAITFTVADANAFDALKGDSLFLLSGKNEKNEPKKNVGFKGFNGVNGTQGNLVVNGSQDTDFRTDGHFSAARMCADKNEGKSNVFTLTLSPNGGYWNKVTAKFDFANGDSQTQSFGLGGYYFGDPLVFTEVEINNNITVSKIEATNLPEPTVLALLALGVAGLALKRKVA